MIRSKPTVRHTNPYANIWTLPFVIVLVDQISKFIANHVTSVVQNTGTIFGLFGNNLLWAMISFVIVVVMIVVVKRRPAVTQEHRIVTFAIMLVVGGGLSNIIDRIFRGYVLDFIQIPLWPTFNVADACISIGITLLLWYTFFRKEPVV